MPVAALSIMQTAIDSINSAYGVNLTVVGFPQVNDLNTILDSTDHKFGLGVGFYEDNGGSRGGEGLDLASKKVGDVLRV